MYISQGSNEYLHLTVKEIADYSMNERPFIILTGKTKIMVRHTTSPSGIKLTDATVKCFIKGQLINYVLAEIDIGDNVFVVGRTDSIYNKKYNCNERITQVDLIYKEDWMKYYKNGNSLNPVDTEDML